MHKRWHYRFENFKVRCSNHAGSRPSTPSQLLKKSKEKEGEKIVTLSEKVTMCDLPSLFRFHHLIDPGCGTSAKRM